MAVRPAPVGPVREFRQFDVEVLGAAEPGPTSRSSRWGTGFLRGRGLSGSELEVNSIGDEVCRPAYREQLIAYLEAHRDRLRDEHRDRFRDNPLRVLDCKDEACRAVSKDAPRRSRPAVRALRASTSPPSRRAFGTRAGVRPPAHAGPRPRLLHPHGVRVREPSALSEAQATFCGGGRYDGLAEVLGGPPTPGVGFGIGPGPDPAGHGGEGSIRCPGRAGWMLRRRGGRRRREPARRGGRPGPRAAGVSGRCAVRRPAR